MKMVVFLVVAPYSLVQFDRSLKGTSTICKEQVPVKRR
jgi:hypothetical protein